MITLKQLLKSGGKPNMTSALYLCIAAVPIQIIAGGAWEPFSAATLVIYALINFDR